MNKGSIHPAKKIVREAVSFFVPKKLSKKTIVSPQEKKITVLVPTYKPQFVTYQLVKDLVTWYKNVRVVVIDDCTPLTEVESMKVLKKMNELSKENTAVTVLRTPTNRFKASALNYGLEYLINSKKKTDVVVTVDDDVAILDTTLIHMTEVLFSQENIGAVCSLSLVKNKNHNLLTRLQGLEYHGFNITKIADTGFLHGPLVMQGMLTAFRFEAIKGVNGFDASKLIEDYDITVRIKSVGWKVAIAPKALAWTYVPETLGTLWKQRIRWSYGGLIVIKEYWRHLLSVFQDIIGHMLFLSLFILVILSLNIAKHSDTPPLLIAALLTIALLHFLVALTFNFITLLTYRERDGMDWFLKLTVLPEFAYSNLLNAVLIGSYLFFIFNEISFRVVKRIPALARITNIGTRTFHKIGYSVAWGTRA